MGYQALLFCPDEKVARSVTQVLSELDFTVIPCTEPFGAVKKLMGEHFDAVVVDCDNEQNATLLFKSARNTPNNQSSLAVAVVEGQAGVAKAFRIGANLVLTKPINVEQAKGTLRVARGLLRKSEAGKPGAPAAGAAVKLAKPVPAPPKPTPQVQNTKVVTPRPAPPAAPFAKAATAGIPSQKPPQPRVVASIPSNITESDTEILDLGDEVALPPIATAETKIEARTETAKIEAAKIETKIAASQAETLLPRPSLGLSHASAGGFGSGAASAPAPAREPEHHVSTGDKPSAAISEPSSETGKVADLEDNAASIDGASAPEPAFTFGGNVESGGGKTKKAMLAVAAVVLIAAVGAAVWLQWVRSSGAPTPFEHPVAPLKTPAPRVSPNTAPAATSPANSFATPSSTSPVQSSNGESMGAPQSTGAAKSSFDSNSDSNTPGTDDAEAAPAHSSKANAKANSDKAPATSKAPATKADAPAIVIKNNLSQKAVAKAAPTSDAPAPSITGIAPGDNGGSLPNLMGGQSDAPAPVLGMLTVSQGVSRGLLVKKAQPVYPASALQMHIEGTVELQATISKAGDISAVKIVSGDPRLARAAVDAVKQWKYKPYLLNGEPVEIQTQVTMNFKLPN
jgi:TonB family protein